MLHFSFIFDSFLCGTSGMVEKLLCIGLMQILPWLLMRCFNSLTEIAHFRISRSLQSAAHCNSSKPPQPLSFRKLPFSESSEVSLLHKSFSPSSEKNLIIFQTKPSFREYLLFLGIRYFTCIWSSQAHKLSSPCPCTFFFLGPTLSCQCRLLVPLPLKKN